MISTGRAYLFVHRAGAKHLGHVGWGFGQRDGSFLCGSTENTGPHRVVPPGGDTTFWSRVCLTEAEMLAEMRRPHRPRPGQSNAYDAYRSCVVRVPDPLAARDTAEWTRRAGYNLLSNNCLHHARAILSAYGVPDGAEGLASALTHPGPNAWFGASFGEAQTAEL
ncbi:hypothetical protein [Deinococcus sp.]|uniref:hypothetical protein n=1 Tax=Deinococcus sp. TaxID=47478 RepID=UPI003C79E7CF